MFNILTSSFLFNFQHIVARCYSFVKNLCITSCKKSCFLHERVRYSRQKYSIFNEFIIIKTQPILYFSNFSSKVVNIINKFFHKPPKFSPFQLNVFSLNAPFLKHNSTNNKLLQFDSPNFFDIFRLSASMRKKCRAKYFTLHFFKSSRPKWILSHRHSGPYPKYCRPNTRNRLVHRSWPHCHRTRIAAANIPLHPKT